MVLNNRQPRHCDNLTEIFETAEKQQQKSAVSLKNHREKTSLALTDSQKIDADLQAKLKASYYNI